MATLPSKHETLKVMDLVRGVQRGEPGAAQKFKRPAPSGLKAKQFHRSRRRLCGLLTSSAEQRWATASR